MAKPNNGYPRTIGRMKIHSKRTVSERELDFVDIARLYVRGHTQVEIVDWIAKNRRYSLSQSTVVRELKIIRERWQELYLSDMDQIKSKELAKIDELERQAWEDLQRSRQDYDELEHLTTTDQWAGGDKSGNEKGADGRTYKRERLTRKRKQRDANTRFMEIILTCIDRRIKIFGLDAPREVTVNWRQEAKAAGIDPDQYQTVLEQQFIQAAMQSGKKIEKPEADSGDDEEE